MNRSSTASYDLFKLIVALILAAILILMLLRGCATSPVPSAPVVNTLAPTEAEAAPPPATVEIEEVIESATPSLIPPTVDPTATPTEAAPTPTPTSEPTAEPTSAPAEATATAPAEGQSNTSCNTSVPSQLSVGDTAQVLQRLNMRSGPAIDAQILQTNSIGTQVEIIGGPVCTPRGDRAYQWWQVRLANGAEGWSAESPLQESAYFLEPVP
jgi:cytoskeletal protein RodZ